MKQQKFEICFVTSCESRELTPEMATWEELKGLFRTVSRRGNLSLAEYHSACADTRKAEKDGWGWIPCSLHDRHGRRVRENMKEAGLVVLDIDVGMPLDRIKEVLAAYEYAVHTSYSHTIEKPKWRVIMPLVEAIPACDLAIVFDYFNDRFSGQLDKSCGHDAARLYYLPACPSDAEHLFTFVENAGNWVDGRLICKNAQRSAPTTIATTSTRRIATADPFSIGASTGERNQELAKRVGHCIAKGLAFDDTLEKCKIWNALNDEPLPDQEVASTVRSVFKTHQRRITDKTEDLDAVVDEMNGKYAWNKRHARVFRFEFMDHVSPETLKNQFANTEIESEVKGQRKVVTHAEAWLRSPRRRNHRDVTFSPGEPNITADDYINLWRGWPVRPTEGDIVPWRNLLNHLFAGHVEHQKWFEQWLAYPFRHPGFKLNTAVVLWSTVQGVGKSLIGETVGRLYQPHFRIISAAELHGTYNGWAKDVQFVLGEENASNDHRADSNKLKHLITGSTIVINEKYQPVLELRNQMNFLFTSNHPDAFHLDEFDRRFFIWEIKGARLPDEFFADFVDWRDNRGGLAALMNHFMTLDLSGFDPKARAPETQAKLEMIAHSRTEVERWLKDMLDGNVISLFGKEVTTLEEVVARYHSEGHGRTNTTAMGKALRRISTPSQRRASTRRGRKNLISLTNHDRWSVSDNDMWVREFEKTRGAQSSPNL